MIWRLLFLVFVGVLVVSVVGVSYVAVTAASRRDVAERPQVGDTELVYVHDDARGVGCWAWMYQRDVIYCLPDAQYRP